MPTTSRRPTQPMYPSPEHDDDQINDEDDFEEDERSWGVAAPLSFSRPQMSSSVRSSRTTRTTNRATTSGNTSQYSKLYTHFVSRYRSNPEENDDPRNDPDSHYFQHGLGQLNDAGDTSDDERLGGSSLLVDGLDGSPPLDSEPAQPLTQQERERLEWQALLTSVLSGDVLKNENSRITGALKSQGHESANLHLNIWYGVRAKFHGRTVEEEKKKLDERRVRTVDGVINEILNFRVSDLRSDRSNSAFAFQEVDALLHRLDVVHSLYPSLKAFYTDKPLASEPAFQSRCDTLNTWYTVHTTLEHHFALLRRWTGSETLDVNQPNTSLEAPIALSPTGSRGSVEMTDGTSFVERLLKEESMQITFEKGFLVVVHNFLGAARDAQVNLAGLFKEMNLPTFERELLPLISFPTKLVQACLRLRLDYIHKLKEPDIVIIDSMTEDLKLSIGLACALKRQYETILAPDPGGNWNLPQCISEDYDDTILEATTDFFKLLHWKLKSGSKAILFKETDVLEAQWGTFNDVSITAAEGSSLVAEQLCSLTNKLIVRVTNYFETQVRVPNGKPSPDYLQRSHSLKLDQELLNNLTPINHSDAPRAMSDEQVVGWYSKILESVRLRYRKLQRFARMLTQQFSNSAEYTLDEVSMDDFITQLVASDHFLVYTHSLEEDGIYIVASHSLIDQPELIHKILDEAFPVSEQVTEDGVQIVTNTETLNQYAESAGYLLILSPQSNFLWNGRVVLLSVPKIPLEMRDNRVLLIADGSQRRLNFAKQAFMEALQVEDEDEEGSVSLNLPCIIEAQAHLPNVNRELRKISRSTSRLAESIVDSVHHVRSALRTTDGGQEILANWFLYASDHGQHAHRHMERQSLIRFNRRLIELAISWVSFICDDCDPTDSKTFKWAVSALEFTLQRTKRYILHLPEGQFELLRQKVASCMTLLISHFDILGARSIQEAAKEKERREEIVKSHISRNGMTEDDFPLLNQTDDWCDPNARLFWGRVWKALREVDEARKDTGMKHRTLGKVLSEEIAEDRSLSSLASSSSNISVKWQQGKFIGAGAYGSVYLALNLDNGSLMAVKEIKFQELSGLSNLFSQIKEELRVMEMLHHPNVVEYYGIEVHRDKVYIFEEYCQGGSLAALLEHGRIEEESIIQVYTMQMLDGLVYLHSQGIVHRDVKPDNILLDHEGVIKFVDFGAAKILAKNQRTLQRTRKVTEMPFNIGSNQNANGVPALSNGLTGTPMYMSPEVIKNDNRGRRGAMDIWSMGCVVLEFATGRKPWSNLDNEWAIMFHIGVATQHPPLPEPDQMSELGIDFIRQCLIIDPVRRPTASELLNHPWMLEFRETFMQYEAPDPTSDAAASSGEATEDTAVTRQAALMHEKEIEEIHRSSPTTP